MVNQSLFTVAYQKRWLLTDVKFLIRIKLHIVLINFSQILDQNLHLLFQAHPRISKILGSVSTSLDEDPLQYEELNEAFNSLKTNKSPGFDDISPSVVKRCHENI